MCGECDCKGVICEGVSVILSLCRYANIFVTSPSPENLQTLFQFVLKGFDAVGYSEHEDYELVQSTNPAYGCHWDGYTTERSYSTWCYTPSSSSSSMSVFMEDVDSDDSFPILWVSGLDQSSCSL